MYTWYNQLNQFWHMKTASETFQELGSEKFYSLIVIRSEQKQLLNYIISTTRRLSSFTLKKLEPALENRNIP